MNPTVLLIGVDAAKPVDYSRWESPHGSRDACPASRNAREFSVYLWIVARNDAMLLVSYERKYSFALSDESSSAHLLRSRIRHRSFRGT